MGRPEFAQTAYSPFNQDNGDPDVVVATTVCPYCKHIISVHHCISSDEMFLSSECPHLLHHTAVTGHNCIFKFYQDEETEND